MSEEDITLPEDKTEADSKTSVDEKRELSDEQKKILRKQKEFEFGEVEGIEKRKKEEVKEKKKDTFFRWVIGVAAILLLVGLYFWLLR